MFIVKFSNIDKALYISADDLLSILHHSVALIMHRTLITYSKSPVITYPTFCTHPRLELRWFTLAPIVFLSSWTKPGFHKIGYLLELCVMDIDLYFLIWLLVCLFYDFRFYLAILLDDFGLGLFDDCLLGNVGQSYSLWLCCGTACTHVDDLIWINTNKT